MSITVTNGNFFCFCNPQSQFQFQFRFKFIRRNFCHNNLNNVVVQNPNNSIRKSIDQKCKLGSSRLESPLSIFDQLNSINPRPSIVDYNRLFTAMIKIRPDPPLCTVISLCKQVELSGILPDWDSIDILAKCYCQLGHVGFGFSLFGRHIKLEYNRDLIILSTLLNGLIDSDDLGRAVRFLDRMVKLKRVPDYLTYAAMVEGLCRVGDNVGAIKLVRDMERKANVAIYNTILDSLCKDELLPQAQYLFREMKLKGVFPDGVTYNTLVRGLCSVGRWDESKALLSVMLDENIVPSVETYNIMIDMYCREGNVEEARAVLESMIEKGMHPSVITCSALLDGYCLRGEMKEAGNILDVMVKDGFVPNVVTFSSLIHGYCKSTNVEKVYNPRSCLV